MMGRAICLCVILVAGLSVLRAAGPTDGRADDRAPADPPARSIGVAVVELFTSQGCSSCPPAEKVLGDLSRAAERDGRPIFTLAFHVDYWNRLGWADTFSDPAFSRRQEQYAKSLGLDDLYTPQMVVNDGRRLEEPSVVRWFKTVPASDAGNVAVPALPGVRADHASVIVYAQRPGNGPILGAAAASLP